MRPTKRSYFLILAIIFMAGAVNVSAQQAASVQKVKSIVVLEEKFDKLVSKQVKESETTYDIKGNILEDIKYLEGKVDKHFKYQYDENNNKIKETEFAPTGNIAEYSEYKYENNLRIEKIVYDPKGKIKLKKVYVYTTW
jgi:hypothetical protein